jgi:hypothetical protein
MDRPAQRDAEELLRVGVDSMGLGGVDFCGSEMSHPLCFNDDCTECREKRDEIMRRQLSELIHSEQDTDLSIATADEYRQNYNQGYPITGGI